LKAARELGISRCYLHRLLKQLEIEDVNLAEMESPEEFEEAMPERRPHLVGNEGLALRSQAARFGGGPSIVNL
jgi:hypothetical protein